MASLVALTMAGATSCSAGSPPCGAGRVCGSHWRDELSGFSTHSLMLRAVQAYAEGDGVRGDAAFVVSARRGRIAFGAIAPQLPPRTTVDRALLFVAMAPEGPTLSRTTRVTIRPALSGDGRDQSMGVGELSSTIVAAAEVRSSMRFDVTEMVRAQQAGEFGDAGFSVETDGPRLALAGTGAQRALQPRLELMVR